MDCQYMHDDATMVVFDLYCSLLEESGYSHIPPEHKSSVELLEIHKFYTRLFNKLKHLGYVSKDTSSLIDHVLEKVLEKAYLELDCESEEETSRKQLEHDYALEEQEEYENDLEAFEEREVFNDGIDG